MEITNNTAGYSRTAAEETDAVLVAFAQTKGAEVGDWMRRYPAQARDLARLAADTWAGNNEHPALAASSSGGASVAADRLREIGLNALRACRPAPQQTVVTFSHLLNTARAKGWETEALAARLEVPYGLLFKLHRRLLSPASIPHTLVTRLADSIERTVDEVNAYLRQPAMLAAGASYRADDAPQVGAQESFADALATDPETTDDQRLRWQTDTSSSEE